MKKILCVLCLLLLLLCVLTACDVNVKVDQNDNKDESKTDACANGHTPGEWEEIPATCTARGTKQKSCTVCKTVLESEVTSEALGHVPGEWSTATATCTEAGGQVKRCTRCEAVVEKNLQGEPLGHSAEWVITKLPTTETTGIKSFVCTRCKVTLETVELDKLGGGSNPSGSNPGGSKPSRPGLIDPGKDENGRELDDLDQYDLNYQGEEITLLYWKEVERPEFEQKELANDNVLDAIYDRNINVEDRLGVDLVFVPMFAAYGDGVRAEFLRKIDAVRLAGTHDYDIIATYARTEAALAIRGHLQDFSKIETSYMNLEKPWWPQQLVDNVSFGDGAYYFVSGDMSTNVLWMMHCMFINKDLFTQLQLENPYQAVRNGSWTIDKMIEITKDQWRDLDNNNKPSVDDQIGFCALNYVCDSFYPGSNMRYFEADEQATLKVSPDYTSAKATMLIEKLGRWASDNSVWITYGMSDPEMHENTRRLFQRGRTLIWFEHVCFAESELAMGNVNFSYGMIPAPKYDANQRNYYTGMGNPWSLYGIYADLDERGDRQATLSMLTAVLECYASEGFRLTTPEIFEVNMSLKYAESKDETDMFEYVRSGIVFDLGKIFSAETNNLPETASNAIVTRTSWSARYEAILPAAEEKLAKIVAEFRAEQTQ